MDAGNFRPDGPPSWRASKTRRLISLYCNAGLVIYPCLLLKNALIAALNSPLLARLRWLDCLLLGRMQVATRIPESSKYCVSIIDCYMIINRLVVRHFANDVELFMDEFVRKRLMLSGHVVNQLSAGSAGPPEQPKSPPQVRMVTFYLVHFILIGWAGNLLYMLIATGPMYVTRRGFELVHANCVRWILLEAAGAKQQAQNSSLAPPPPPPPPPRNSYEFIYRIDPARTAADIFESDVPFVLPLVDLVAANAYHLARLLADSLEVLLSQLDIVFFYSLHTYLVLRIHAKLWAQVGHLRAQLAAVGDELRQLPSSSRPARPLGRAHEGAPSVCEAELVAVQAGLMDYFHLVRAYNSYVGTTSLINIGHLVFYAFMLLIRHLQTDQSHVVLDRGDWQLEYLYLLSIGVLPMVMLMLCKFALASRARRMFAEMAAVMALDDGNSTTKLHWITLLSFYHPRTLFCFTMLNTIELSWLFGLKLFFWVFSALSIVAQCWKFG